MSLALRPLAGAVTVGAACLPVASKPMGIPPKASQRCSHEGVDTCADDASARTLLRRRARRVRSSGCAGGAGGSDGAGEELSMGACGGRFSSSSSESTVSSRLGMFSIQRVLAGITSGGGGWSTSLIKRKGNSDIFLAAYNTSPNAFQLRFGGVSAGETVCAAAVIAAIERCCCSTCRAFIVVGAAEKFASLCVDELIENWVVFREDSDEIFLVVVRGYSGIEETHVARSYHLRLGSAVVHGALDRDKVNAGAIFSCVAEPAASNASWLEYRWLWEDLDDHWGTERMKIFVVRLDSIEGFMFGYARVIDRWCQVVHTSRVLRCIGPFTGLRFGANQHCSNPAAKFAVRLLDASTGSRNVRGKIRDSHALFFCEIGGALRVHVGTMVHV